MIHAQLACSLLTIYWIDLLHTSMARNWVNGADAPDLDTSINYYYFEAKAVVVCAASALYTLLYLPHILVFTQSLGWTLPNLHPLFQGQRS